jgi:CHAT domain-containing protein
MMIKRTAMAVAMTASLMMATPAAAQTAQGMQNQMQSKKPISEQTLQQFAAINKEVAAVANKYRGQAQSAQDKQARQELAKQAQEEMAKVVKDSPMSVAEYNRVITRLQKSEELKKRYESMSQ